VRPTAVPASGTALIKQGDCVGEHRVARLMRVEGIRAKTVKKWRATTLFRGEPS
jgi:putative transposase